MSFEKLYPKLSNWVDSRGWIEIGIDDYSRSMLRIVDEGGLVWEDNESKSLDAALKAGEEFIKNNAEHE